jgi:glycosyltransferase involved in cell wall biosynthesis
MRILLAHNFYQQTGGEDSVFYAEAALLEQHGHAPLRYVLHNNQIEQMSRLEVAAKTVWNRQVHRELFELVRNQSIDVVHFHNTFPLISPAAFSAVRKAGAAVVQTLHNYRHLCPAAVLFRDGRDCEDCIHRKLKLPAIRHKCYRNSRRTTAVLTASLAYHAWRGTLNDDVDLFIAPSESARSKFVEAGWRPEQIVVKPHFIDPDPGPGKGGDHAVFVGRLSHEKGLETLLAAWQKLNSRVPLKIVGDGPQRGELLDAIHRDPSIEWLGRRPMHEVYSIVGNAAFLVVPSRTRETFGRVAIEAFATGTPVIAANHGALADIITEDTGLLFAPSDADDLARCIETFIQHPDRLREMRASCRDEFARHYTGEPNYRQLMDIYQRAIRLAAAKRNPEWASNASENELPLPDNQLG